jgi:phosphoribosylformylglycinamidine synthase PurS subunit
LYKAIIKVTLKKKILDPQGKAIESSLHNLGFTSLAGVRTGKNIEISINENDLERAKSSVQSACEKLLANQVTEEFEYEVFDGGNNVVARFSTQHKQTPVPSGKEPVS